jgi:adenylate cyclase
MAEAIEIQRITDWLVDTTLGSFDMEKLFSDFCQRIRAIGIDVCRVHVVIRTLHPLYNSSIMTWQRDRGLSIERISFTADSGGWDRSPLKAILDSGEEYTYFDMETGNDWTRFPLLTDHKENGATGYMGTVIPFGHGAAALAQNDGVALSWMTDKKGGLSNQEILNLRRLGTRLALAIKMHKREETSTNVLNAYLGADAGGRVLEGRMQRGDVDVMSAVIWYSDLRDSTSLAAELPAEEFMSLLSSYFERTGQPITDHGGSILKFVGDAILAVFPIGDGYGMKRAAREAVQAAWEAVESLKQEVVETSVGPRNLKMGIGLHYGKVLFGNTGLPDRLEFTLIGAAVNETCRIESLTKTAGHPILVSAAVSEHVPIEWAFIGNEELKGIPEPMGIYAPLSSP